jgi:hypothetical protein
VQEEERSEMLDAVPGGTVEEELIGQGTAAAIREMRLRGKSKKAIARERCAMSRYESIPLVTPNDQDYLRWKRWNDTAARERRTAAKAARAVTPSVLRVSVAPAVEAATPVAAMETATVLRAVAPEQVISHLDAVAPVVNLSSERASETPTGSTVIPFTPPAPKANTSVARGIFGRDAEHFLRRDLGRYLPVWDRRILRYAFQREDGRWNTRYRELDVVALDGRRLYIFEIKATRQIEKVKRGIEQLTFAREVLAESFLDVITTLIVVDTDQEDSKTATPVTQYIEGSARLVPVSRLADLTSAYPGA